MERIKETHSGLEIPDTKIIFTISEYIMHEGIIAIENGVYDNVWVNGQVNDTPSKNGFNPE